MRQTKERRTELICGYIDDCKSFADMCRHLGIVPVGGNIATVKRQILELGLDYSHFTGQGWGKDNFSPAPSDKGSIRRMLLRERGHACERCNLSTWQGECIPLELEHINGNSTDNRLENLLLLCCNCHALTPTWRNKKRG